MADNQNNNSGGVAQNKLGQLFVDIGANGLGTLVKGLNTLSAQFLLTKNAAKQAIKPLADMALSAADQVVNYDKLHSKMGVAIKDLQDIKIAAKLINIDPSLVFGQMQAVQQQITRIKTGLDPNGQQGLAMLGIQPFELDQKDPLSIITKIGEKLRDTDAETRVLVLNLLGWSDELAYMFDRMSVALDKQNKRFNENLKLTDEELDRLREFQDNVNVLSVTWDQAQQKFIANQSELNKMLSNTVDWLGGEHQILSGIVSNLYKSLDAIAKAYVWLKTPMVPTLNGQTRAAAKNMTAEQQARYQAITAQQTAAFISQKNEVLGMPKTIPESSSSYYSGGSQKSYSFEIINNNDLDIQVISDDPQTIGDGVKNYISQGTLTEISNTNIPNF